MTEMQQGDGIPETSLGWLKKFWGTFKRLRELERKIEALGSVLELESRVRELEAKLSGPYPADVCKKCGERSLRMTSTYGPANDKGLITQNWQCLREECQMYEARTVSPSRDR